MSNLTSPAKGRQASLDAANRAFDECAAPLELNGHAPDEPASGRRDEAILPEVELPGGDVTITKVAARCGELLGATGRFFSRSGMPVRLIRDDGEPRLEPLRPAALCSDLESVSRLVRTQKTKDGRTIAAPATCSESVAKLINESRVFRVAQPPIRLLTQCPVLVERERKLVEISDYDRESGILAGGSVDPNISLSEAIELLNDLLADFRFSHAGDRARALAAVIVPALAQGGLLGGRAPVDLSEADESQAGKGYRNKLTAAIYNARLRTVTQRTTGGVGSIQETFDAALVSGAAFISLDNFRGRLDLPALESFETEDTYLARIPYAAPMAIDTRRIVVMLTSNQADVTPDFANRSSCVRILKQPGDYEFRSFPEGDLLDHVRANQPRYLGAVFSVIREWHRLDKPRLQSVDHDFRPWARVVGYITEHMLGAGSLFAGHRQAQRRISSPRLTWLRDVAIAVHKAGQSELWLRAHHLLSIVVDNSIETPGVSPAALDEGEVGWLKATRAIGRKLGHLFQMNGAITVDNFVVERREVTDDHWRPRTEFAFFPQTPNDPE